MSRSNRPELSDGTIRLRAPEHRDIDARFKLGNTPEIHHMFGAELNAVPVMTKALAERWYETQLVEPLAWVIEHRGKTIGALRLHSLRPWDASADVAIGILAPKKLGKGLGTRALHLLAAHAFGPLALHRLSARVLDINERAAACFTKVGFAAEGRARQSSFLGGEWHDTLLFGLIKPDYVPPVYDAKPRQKRKKKSQS